MAMGDSRMTGRPRWPRLRIILVAINLRVAIVAAGPLLPVIILDLQLSSAAAGLVLGLPLLAFAVVSPFAPLLARRVGLDGAVFMALLLLAAGTLVRSAPFSNAIWVGTGLLGAAIAVLNVLLPSILSRDLRNENGRMTSVYTAAQGVATAVGAGVVLMLSAVLPGGWRTALAIWAVLAAVSAVVWQLSGTQHRSAFLPVPDPPRRGVERPARKESVRRIWMSPIAWAVTAFMGLQSMAFYVYMSWVPSYQLLLGASELLTGVYTTAFYAVSITSSLVTGRILERMSDHRVPTVVSSTIIALTFVGIIFAPALFPVWSVTGGAACGSLMVIALSFITYRTSDFRSAADLSAMAQSLGYALAAAGPVLFGFLLDRTGSWTVPLTLTAGALAFMGIIGTWAGKNRTIG
jgi:CP family cyanate transporter-like MFS transporter